MNDTAIMEPEVVPEKKVYKKDSLKAGFLLCQDCLKEVREKKGMWVRLKRDHVVHLRVKGKWTAVKTVNAWQEFYCKTCGGKLLKKDPTTVAA